VLSYLEKVASEMKDTTDMIFQILAEEELKWPAQKDSIFEHKLLNSFSFLKILIKDLLINKKRIINNSSLSEFDQAYQNLQVIRQFIIANVPPLQPSDIDGNIVRSLSMAENLIYLIDQAGPDSNL